VRTYSTDEAAHLLSVSGSYVRKLIERGDIDAKKSGRSWRVPNIEVERLRKERSTASGSSATVLHPDAQPDAQPVAQVAQPDAQPVAQVAQSDAQPDVRSDRELRDLRDRVERVEGDKAHLREELSAARAEASQREEVWKVRVVDLERAATVRESRIADMEMTHVETVSDLRGQVAILEAKVREVLEKSQDEAMQLANRNADLADRIAGLVASHEDMHARVVELQPVAEQVPMLQAAVEEKDASLSERDRELGNMRNDIEAIASRPVTGPVFRLLTKGKLRR
jgi:excisionase family DNA binding protein